jgi:hypothetical protein
MAGLFGYNWVSSALLFLAIAVDFARLAAWLHNTAIAVSILADRTV